MAKKKIAVQETPVVDDSAKYHALFKPTWRPEIDCGEHESVKTAQLAIHEVITPLVATYAAAWEQDDDGNWSAAGHDGVEETNMPFAYITRVAAE